MLDLACDGRDTVVRRAVSGSVCEDVLAFIRAGLGIVMCALMLVAVLPEVGNRAALREPGAFFLQIWRTPG